MGIFGEPSSHFSSHFLNKMDRSCHFNEAATYDDNYQKSNLIDSSGGGSLRRWEPGGGDERRRRHYRHPADPVQDCTSVATERAFDLRKEQKSLNKVLRTRPWKEH